MSLSRRKTAKEIGMDFTKEADGDSSYSHTVPDTMLSSSRLSSTTDKRSIRTGRGTTPEEHALLAAIAEDKTLHDTYYRGDTAPVDFLTADVRRKIESRLSFKVDQVVRNIALKQTVLLCFLVDTTGSMSPYIDGVKDSITTIVRKLDENGCTLAGLAFVGYKDWSEGPNHFEIFQFSRDITQFRLFVSRIKSGGGGDFAEDVLGGINQVLELDWDSVRDTTRVMIHFGDAPPHGRIYGHRLDDYPGGHPSDPSLSELFCLMKQMNIDMYFGRINGECDKMVTEFEKHHPIQVMNAEDPKDISKVVRDSVTKSVSVATASVTSSRAGPRLPLDKSLPNYDKLPILDCTVKTLEYPDSIDDIRNWKKLTESVKKGRLQISQLPFDCEAIRYAFRGQMLFLPRSVASDDVECRESEMSKDPTVFKSFINEAMTKALDRNRYEVDLEMTTICSYLAMIFRQRLASTTHPSVYKVKYLKTKLVRVEGRGSEPTYYSSEKEYRNEGKLVRYTNNYGCISGDPSDDKIKVLLAFSHFTFDITDGYLLVCDLQGIDVVDKKGNNTLLLTDPAVHCKTGSRFGRTNLQDKGIRKFFKRHICNEHCRGLGLRNMREGEMA